MTGNTMEHQVHNCKQNLYTSIYLTTFLIFRFYGLLNQEKKKTKEVYTSTQYVQTNRNCATKRIAAELTKRSSANMQIFDKANIWSI